MNQKKESVNYKTRGGGNTIKDKFGAFIADIPDYPFCIVVSKWTTPENSPLYDDDLAEWVIEVCGYFPLGWNLDDHLYPLLKKKPALVDKLSLHSAEDAKAIRKDIEGRKSEGEKSIIRASTYGELECITGLLAAGVDVNAKTADGLTPLHLAAQKGYTKCVRRLLAAPGVDVNIKDTLKRTPLHLAVFLRQTKCIQQLLEAPGVDVNVKKEGGITPLHDAALYGYTEGVRLLLAAPGVDVNIRDTLKGTPLHSAVFFKQTECIQQLLAAPEVDVNAMDLQRNTPLHLAANKGYTEGILQLLTARELEVNAKNVYRFTPLYEAVRAGRVNSVELLLTISGIEIDPTMVDMPIKNQIKELIQNKLKPMSPQTSQGGKPKPTKQKVVYAGKKYVIHMGAKGGKYILVGSEKKKVYV